jgi:hypothetical protein
LVLETAGLGRYLMAMNISVPIDDAMARRLEERVREAGFSSTSSYFYYVAARIDRDGVLPVEMLDPALEEELTADMVSFRKNVTGVDNTVFISVKFPGHAPRIKVAVDPPTHIDVFGNNASVAIADGKLLAGKLPSNVQKQVEAFLQLNRDVLIDYWEKRIDTDELRDRLQPLC